MRRFLLGITVLLASCSNHTSMAGDYTQTVYSWRGASSKQLIARWGTPNEKIVEKSGRQLLIYTKKSFTNPKANYSPQIGVSNQNGRAVITNTNDINDYWDRNLALSCTVMFMTSPGGIVTQAKTLGDNCFFSTDLAKQLANAKKG